MDGFTLLVVASSLAGIIGLIYLLVFGQKSILEWVQERRKNKELGNIPAAVVDSPPQIPSIKIPNNLPPRNEFVGREKEKTQVSEALKSRSYLVTLDGIGGIGKTSLALQIAHECLEASENELSGSDYPTFDGIVWISAKDRGINLQEFCDTIARTLGYIGILRLPPEQKSEDVSKLLRALSCLVIVDNFETISDPRIANFMLELPEPSKGLITTREHVLPQSRIVSLHGMVREEAYSLIHLEGRRLGLSQIEKAEDHVLERLYMAIGGAPLAINWAIGQIKQHGQSLDTVLDNLYGARGDIFEIIFARSWQLLNQNAKLVLVTMPFFRGPASRASIEATTDLHRWDLDESLGQLIEMWLVEETSGELDEARHRYGINPLTRMFAQAKLQEMNVDVRAAHLRAASYFLGCVRELVGGEYWQPISSLINDSIEPERDNIICLMEWCFKNEEYQLAIDLTVALVHYFSGQGYWHERVVNVMHAIDATTKVPSERNETLRMWFLVDSLGWIYCRQGNYNDAERYILMGLEVAEKIQNRCGEALAYLYLAWIATEQGQSELAVERTNRGLSAKCDDYNIVTRLYTSLGTIAHQAGDYLKAQNYLQQALNISEGLGERRVEHWGALLVMADTLVKMGQYKAGKQNYEKLLLVEEDLGITLVGAKSKYGLAVVEELEGNYTKALIWARESVAIFERLGMEPALEQNHQLIQRCEAKVNSANQEQAKK